MSDLQVLADSFYDAFYTNSWRNSSTSLLGLSIADSYRVQNIVCQKRLDAGEEVIGYKVGCTSIAIRDQFGIEEPISGRLFSPHIYGEGIQINRQHYANCAIEPEIVLTVGSDLFGQDLPDEILINAIECVSAGIELHNYTFWHDPPCLQELICSGGIHAGLIVGKKKVSPRDLSFKNDIFSVHQDDKLIASAPALEIMGGPLNSLRWLVNSLSSFGEILKKGSLVIPGSPTELISVTHDCDLDVVIQNVGQVSATFIS
jgi:2-keto-4-pentenoate hydratase